MSEPTGWRQAVNPELLLAGKYGSKLHVWDLRRRRPVQELDLGAEQQMVLELRPAPGRSQAAVVRDLIDRHPGRRKPSLHERARDLCGSMDGAKDLSTRRLDEYGRD